MVFKIGTMSVGDILDRGLKLLLARLPVFYAINLLVLLPAFLVEVFLAIVQSREAVTPEQALATAGSGFLALLLAVILQPLGTAAILYIISQEFVGSHPGIGEAFRFALRRFGALLGTSILAGLAIGAGTLLCLIPGLIFSVWYIFVGQVVVVEALSGATAMTRSKSLSEGYRGRVWGMYALFLAATFLLMGSVIGLAAIFPTQELVRTDTGQRIVHNLRNELIQISIRELISVVIQTYAAICWTLLYFDLRIRKEGYDLELAAREHASIIS
jgi:hypothetical protein